MADTSFAALMQRVQAGEMRAAEELLRQYEPTVRRAIRVRMVNPTLRRRADSMDLCQSVMGSFFVRAALGQYELDSPEKLVGLLVRLARNKVVSLARHEQAHRRDHRRNQADGSAIERVADHQESPSQAVAGAELIERFRASLSVEERYLAQQRADGRAWSELAEELKQSPEALRKQLERAIERVSAELGIDA